MELFAVWPTERSLAVVQRPSESTTAQFRLLIRQSMADRWVVEDLDWHRSPRKGERQETATWFGHLCVASTLSELLLTNRACLELLPIRVMGDDWIVINILGILKGVDLATSDFRLMPPDGSMVHYFEWINIVHSEPLPFEFFKVEGGCLQTFVTATFVNRYKALKLKGLRFELIGHVIASADQAIPRPPRPVKPVPSPSTYREPKLTLKPLPKAWQQELGRSAADGASRLGLDARAGPEATLAALQAEVARLHPLWGDELTDERVGPLTELAALYGNLVCARCGWTWMQLVQARGPHWMAVVSPDGEHALPVAAYMNQQILKSEPTLALLLNMIAEGQLPLATPGRPVILN
jgi:hypothetical protein